jgi:hypothetical protein
MEKGVSANKAVENALRQWLRGHFSVIGWEEGRDLGASKSVMLAKAKRGEWERLYRGVYRDTAAGRLPIQRLRAAFVAAGGQYAISDASAAWLWKLLPQPPMTVELSIRAGSGRRKAQEGFVLHRSRDLEPFEVVSHRTMLVTNPLRTLVDLAGSVLPLTLASAVDVALASKLVTLAGLEAELERLSRKGRPGPAALRRDLTNRGLIGVPDPSVLESKLQRVVQRIEPLGAPSPVAELKVGTDGEYRLDLAWEAVMFAIEVDGYVWHSSPEHSKRDNARRRQLRRMGWFLQVYTWVDVVREPSRVAREIVADYRQCAEARVLPGRPAQGRT